MGTVPPLIVRRRPSELKRICFKELSTVITLPEGEVRRYQLLLINATIISHRNHSGDDKKPFQQIGNLKTI